MNIRPALQADAEGMSEVLNDIFQAGLRDAAGDIDFVMRRYIEHPARILCSVAVDQDLRIRVFQSLKHGWRGNPYGVGDGWGIIGTHIRPDAARRGVGKALFLASLQAARSAKLIAIDATIGEDNEPALAYYEALGFRDYRRITDCVCKAYRLG